MSLKFEAHGAQIDGARDYQEDAFLITPIISETEGKSALLTVLADGMGGHAAGNVASNLAVEAFSQYVTDHYFGSENHNLLLKEALVTANDSLARNIRETAALKGMGCTLVAVLFTETGMQWISVGDSHLFLFREHKLLKKNADHSYGGYLDRMAAEGNQVDENSGYSRHMLLSALTGEPIPAVDSPEHPILLQPGDCVLLSSDGIDTLSQDEMRLILSHTDSPKTMCNSLLAKVSGAQMPRQDNTTVLIVDWPAEVAPDFGEFELDVLPDAPSQGVGQMQLNSSEVQRAPSQNTSSTSQTAHDEEKSNVPGKLSLFFFAALAMVVIGVAWFFSRSSDQNSLVVQTGENLTVSSEQMSVELGEDLHANSSDPMTSDGTDQETDKTATSNVETAEEEAGVEKEHLFTLFNDRLTTGALGPGMIPLPSGEFEMGGTGVSPPSNERPKHKVKIASFAISQNEVTRAEFALFTGKKIKKQDRLLPVNFVSYADAVAYTHWLSKQTGATYRLPTESEWEYAARAGTSSPYFWGYKLEENKATCVGCGIPMEPSSPTTVGQHDANAFGLIDLSGNVAEWTLDCYHSSYEGAPVDGSAWREGDCVAYVIRGGSYTNAVKSIRSSTRDQAKATSRTAQIGLRVVRELP